jgi:hypothetical protein
MGGSPAGSQGKANEGTCSGPASGAPSSAIAPRRARRKPTAASATQQPTEQRQRDRGPDPPLWNPLDIDDERLRAVPIDPPSVGETVGQLRTAERADTMHRCSPTGVLALTQHEPERRGRARNFHLHPRSTLVRDRQLRRRQRAAEPRHLARGRGSRAADGGNDEFCK